MLRTFIKIHELPHTLLNQYNICRTLNYVILCSICLYDVCQTTACSSCVVILMQTLLRDIHAKNRM